MRRNDKEIKEFINIIEVVSKCNYINVGISDKNVPYIVPVSFGFEIMDDSLVLYFHGAMAGKKYTLIEQNDMVFVSGSLCKGYLERENGAITCQFESFMAEGRAIRIFGDEARKALDRITEHCGFNARPCPNNIIDKTAVYKIICNNLTGKKELE